MPKNVTCCYCTVSVVVKVLPGPLIDVGEYYQFVVREVAVPSFHHVSRWCIFFICGLQPSTGLERGERNTLSQCCLRVKNNETFDRCRSCIPEDLFGPEKRLWWL